MGRTAQLSDEQVKQEILRLVGDGRWPKFNELRQIPASSDRLKTIYNETQKEYRKYDKRHIKALETLTGLNLLSQLNELEKTRPSKLNNQKLRAYLTIHRPELEKTETWDRERLLKTVKEIRNTK